LDFLVFEGELVVCEELDGFGDQAAFYGLDSLGEACRGVVGAHRDLFLEDDGSGVVFVVDEVDGCARDGFACGEHGFVDALAVEAFAAGCGNQRRVYVDCSAVESAAGFERREETEAGDEVDFVPVEFRVDGVVEVARVWVLLAGHRERGNAVSPRAFESSRVFLRADHRDDLRTERAGFDLLEEVFETRSLTREQYRHAQGVRLRHRFISDSKMRRVAGDLFIV
jgi:hypothetical protein